VKTDSLVTKKVKESADHVLFGTQHEMHQRTLEMCLENEDGITVLEFVDEKRQLCLADNVGTLMTVDESEVGHID